MKRTGFINLERMRKGLRAGRKPVAVAVTAALISGCGQTEEVDIYTSLQECLQQQLGEAQMCHAAFQEALQEAEQTAPKYASQADCEYDFGEQQCVTQQRQGGSWFMPAMAGFMMGRALSGGDRVAPLYQSSQLRSPVHGKWVTSDGKVVANADQRQARVSPDSFRPKPMSARPLSRGGFGNQAAARSSWGG